MLKGLIQSKNIREEKRSTKSTPVEKMAIGTYISIITLNVNRLNAPTKRYRLAGKIQKQDIYLLCARDPLQIYKHIQTKTERIEKSISCKWKSKESWSSNPRIRQNQPRNKRLLQETWKDTT